MITFSNTWNKLRSKKYREAFVLQAFKRIVPFQISAMRKQRGWSQDTLARRANVTQGVVSRAEDPDYGNLTIKTICRIAAGFDVAFIGKFVPFSELDRWFTTLSEESGIVPSFDEENSVQEAMPFWDRSLVLSIASAGRPRNEASDDRQFPPMKAQNSTSPSNQAAGD